MMLHVNNNNNNNNILFVDRKNVYNVNEEKELKYTVKGSN